MCQPIKRNRLAATAAALALAALPVNQRAAEKSVKTPLTVQTYETLESLTREQLRNLAARVNVPRGRDKKNTIANLARAISDGKLWYKSEVTIFTPPTTPSATWTRKALLRKKFRSYKPDRVIQDVLPFKPVPAAP